MRPFDRRDLMRFVAGGAAATAVASQRTTASHHAPAPAQGGAAAPARGFASGNVPPVGIANALHGEATVMLCRSFDTQVYLHFDAQRRGFVALDARGFAVAAACQAAGRKVAMLAWGHDPDACDGLGRFDGALLAVDALDLPGADPLGDLG